ncbi:MAG: glycosyl transferase family 2 [Thiothrix sp.]|nr:MAG: glycosyl transferase family 2 [Thiothrix sp.]
MSTKVSVGIITYNHEKYIADAIEGALFQKTDFDYEIIISDDCSTDKTANIVAEYRDKYPDIIHPVPHVSNLGPRKNFESIINACQGEYIASLDGDDYWSDPKKLQRQYDYLNVHSELSACFHPSLYRYENGKEDQCIYPPDRKTVYGIEDILRENCISSNTLMFRSSAFRGFPAWMHENSDFPGDLFILFSCLQKGEIGYLDECMAVYRVHNQGLWSSLSEVQKNRSEMRMNRFLQGVVGDQYRVLLMWKGVRLRMTYLLNILRNGFSGRNIA